MLPDKGKRRRPSRIYAVVLAVAIALVGFTLYGGLHNPQVITRPSVSTPAVQVAPSGDSTREPQPTVSTDSRLQTRMPSRASVRPLRSTLLQAPIGSMADVRLSSYERVPYMQSSFGIPPLPRVITYTVQSGDTLSSIAARFRLSIDALRWSNPDIEHNPDDIYPGQVLRIPPLNGIVVDVKEGDTIERLAKRYNVPPEVIRDYAPNRLRPPYTLTPGMVLVIPGGSKQQNLPPPRPYPGYMYMWPARGVITQGYHSRHRAIDIGTIYGAYVYAARAGRVRTVRWDDTGYGNMIIIDHGGGWNTLYAHLKGPLVKPGQYVRQGDVIARAGGTGRATGPHVHFEIRKGRVRYNPLDFLPPSP